VQIRRWILFLIVAFLGAVTLRYLVPGRYSLAIRSGGALRGMHLNQVAFWMVLAFAAIVIVVRVIVEMKHRWR
jgi:hypothetical protein